MTVIVFGSINMDLVALTPRLPEPGETLLGHRFFTVPGGKGANQAVATARLGIPTEMVGRIGGDGFGRDLLASLRSAGVGCDHVLVDEAATSGVAVIAVEDEGENQIIVIPGANECVAPIDAERLTNLLPHASALLLQLEIPIPAVMAAAQAAHRAGVRVILDPAPAPLELPIDLYPLIDIITPNQLEAGQLTGIVVDDLESAANAATVLRQRGVNTAIVKLGPEGALWATTDDTFLIPAFPVKAIDTVAAGDAFNGGLAAALARGLPLRRAATWAAAVAALSVTKAGAQPAMPSWEEFSSFLGVAGDEAVPTG